ncbi:MAG: hypothetical protein CL885_04500 [Dehalococcoidia bacterium]|nr:hypothetical protein [Dehalococcoidia bacterium]
MKVGDLIRANFPKSPPMIGVILDIFKNHSRQLWEAKVLWKNGEIKNIALTGWEEVINENR